MTQKQMIEEVKQHHPEISETQIRSWMNQAQEEFCAETRILKSAHTFDTTADRRWYGLPETMLEIVSVDFDGYEIPRLSGNPEKRDLT